MTMDFKGQDLAERLFLMILSATTPLAFLLGFFTSSVPNMMLTFGVGTSVALAVAAIPWPIYRRNPLVWATAPAGEATNNDAGEATNNDAGVTELSAGPVGEAVEEVGTKMAGGKKGAAGKKGGAGRKGAGKGEKAT
mmetsp:Transcript_1689/g.4546  ORF Transcript_1689/g.4546 Transcript_1689/m.4546 type:complete len:137 (+) Transcript_1689:81-491(+)